MGLRVLHTAESLQPTAGSVAVALPGLWRSLHETGVRSTVVTTDNVAVDCPHARVTSFHQAQNDDLLRTADVVHFHGFDPPVAGFVSRLARAAARSGIPYIVSPLGALSPSPFRRQGWRERFTSAGRRRKLLAHAAAIAALNQREADDLERFHRGGSIDILPYGLDFADYSSGTGDASTRDAAVPPGRRCLLVLGAIHPQEGLVPLLQTAALLGELLADWHVVIAGPERGPWRKQLQAAIHRKGGGDRATFDVNPDVTTQRGWLARASLLAAMAPRVHCPISATQALAAGVPVLASPFGLAEKVDTGVPRCGVGRDEIAQGLRSLLAMSDKELRSLGQRAGRAARDQLDWSVLAPRYAEMYHTVGGRIKLRT